LSRDHEYPPETDLPRRCASRRHLYAARKGLPPVGIGIFGRAGCAPRDRNVIDQFYSLGIGGFGMLIPGRDQDQWGVGWAGTHISSDLRDDAAIFRVDLSSFERALASISTLMGSPNARFSPHSRD
jgi:hypothetical protein